MDSYERQQIESYERKRMKPVSRSKTMSRSTDKNLSDNRVFDRYERLCSYIGPRNSNIKKQSVLIIDKIIGNLFYVNDFQGNSYTLISSDLLVFPPNDIKMYSKEYIKKVIPKNYFYNFREQRYYYIKNGINPYPNNDLFRRVNEI